MRSAILSSSIFSVLFLLGSSSDSQATIIEDLIGDVAFAPVSVTLDTPDAATNINGVVHVVGQHDGKAARQLIDLATGTVGQVEFFDSLLSAQGNGGDRSGGIASVQLLENGQVIYVGQSAGSFDVRQPTYWLDPAAPQGGLNPQGQQATGNFLDVSRDGVFVGSLNQLAAYGSPAELPQFLTGFDSVAAQDISSNGQYIAGSLLWTKTTTGGFTQFETNHFDFSQSGQIQNWLAVEIDPVVGDAVFVGTYFDLNTFATATGFWRADGTFVGSVDGSSVFRDFEVWNGQLVAGLTGGDDSLLLAITDFSMITLESIIGVKSQIFDDGLFVGSAGFLTNGPNGAFITTHRTSGDGGGGTEVPEPSTIALLGIGAAFAARRRSGQIS